MSRTALLAAAGYRGRVVQFGFNSGANPDDFASDYPRYQADVDAIAAHGSQWVRFGVNSGAVISGGDETSITWDETALGRYDDQITYARSKGLQVYLVLSGAPDYAAGYTSAQYLSITQVYWSFLVDRWATQVGVWQLFNESNGSHFQTFESLDAGFPSGYLTRLAALLAAGRTIVKAANPAALVTTAAEGFPMNDAMQTNWQTYFDAIATPLDIIGLHMYPQDNATEIAAMGTRAAAMRARYGKPVAVSEFGMPTSPAGGFTEANQATYLPQQITSLKAGQVAYILLYEMRDQAQDISADAELSFGIRRYNRTGKSGLATIMNAMR